MRFHFEIGGHETHTVELSHRKFSGRLNVTVDGKPIPGNHLPHFSARREFVVSVLVGEKERHEVRVQIVRPLLLAALRRGWRYNVFVDGRELKTFVD